MTAIFQFHGEDKELGEYIFTGADTRITNIDEKTDTIIPTNENAKKIFIPNNNQYTYGLIGNSNHPYTTHLIQKLQSGLNSEKDITRILDKIYEISEDFNTMPPAFLIALRDGKSLDMFAYASEERFLQKENLLTSGIGKQTLYDFLKDTKYKTPIKEIANKGYHALNEAAANNIHVGGYMDYTILTKDKLLTPQKSYRLTKTQ